MKKSVKCDKLVKKSDKLSTKSHKLVQKMAKSHNLVKKKSQTSVKMLQICEKKVTKGAHWWKKVTDYWWKVIN